MTERKSIENWEDRENIIRYESNDLFQATTEYEVNRPPKSPGPTLGPYYQFVTTDLEKMLWIGSALIFRHVTYDRPNIEFTSEAKLDYDWEILYDNIFDMRAYRINLYIELRNSNDDEKICWKIDWGDYSTNGLFYIAQYDQKWRGAFFSCNGFDIAMSKQVISDMTYSTVWNHLHSVHEKTPLHLLLWGGDQVYHDGIFEDVPFLKVWCEMKWDQKWTVEFDNESKKAVEQYYFNNYAEQFECRPEVKKALGSIPSLMMWDDHDIFDGAGSYPPLLRNSPTMLGLFEAAQKMRLLFQHHTTPEKARKHHLFGFQGHNFFAHCGPNLAILGADSRTERDEKTVQHEKTWNMIFEKLANDLQDVKHLIVVFPIPFSFARYKIAEPLLEVWKNITMKWHNIPYSKKTNSVFDLPELYDDRLDKWTHEAHLDERNNVLFRFQELAHKKRVRITFFSGDVHCCGLARFRTRGNNAPSYIHDAKFMYQVVSSAIVNKPPPLPSILCAHFFQTKWYPISHTEEELIDFFDIAPDKKTKLFLKKVLANRNWCYFEQCTTNNSTSHTIVPNGFLESYFWPFIDYCLSSIGLNHILNWKHQTSTQNLTRQTSYITSFSTPISQPVQEGNNLQLRLWLENIETQKGQRTFTNYDLFIPLLE
ncbi:unnamed protein product [Rotaria sp. Silwood1]|nr:unnamed protein product [Rotaria sp. Silwood1]CAF1560817.1 unnamed protein product [Rotaria sp. Silwood1]CAF3651839.1 unnamed protein product [Rotaria sp. Silwood1]CAF3767542.1 unnamed protein product [Rotaria sp. Silwood1]CAF4686129.1 unnamed protein product [Rotaria sp. Silwood1]